MKKKAFIPVSALMGVLLLTLVVTMTLFVAEPDRVHAQELLSPIATLSELEVVGGPDNELTAQQLTQPDGTTTDFAPAINDYTLRIGFNDSGVIVTPTGVSSLPGDQSQTIRVNGTVVESEASHNVAVAAGGLTTITIAVTAPAGNTNNYTVKVYRNRQTLSSNADFSSLSISPSGGLKLSSNSTPSAPIYEARVQSSKVTVSYRLSDSAGGASAVVAVVSGGGTTIEDATKPNEITLDAQGATGTFTVTVTPESGNPEKIYTIAVYRIRDNPSTEARLRDSAGLGLTAHDDNGTVVNIVGYAYGQDLMAYDLTVSNAVDYVTLDPSVGDLGAHYVINPRTDSRPAVDNHQVNLRAGVDTTITVTVTAEDPSATETYTLKIYKRRPDTATNPAIGDTTLRGLRLSPGTLTPTFSSSTMSYSVQVEDDVDKVTVSYTPTNNLGGVTVEVTAQDGSDDDVLDVSDDNEVTLAAGGVISTIRLRVTAEDGNTVTADTGGNLDYTIAVYRLRALPSANAALTSLSINGGTNNVAGFTAGDLSAEAHKVTVPFTTTVASVVAEPTSAATGATAEIAPASPVALMAGATTTITVTVTAEDGVTTAAYTVIVYRQRDDTSDDATLFALNLSDGTLSPDFMSDREDYDARVGNDVDEVTVSYTPTDNAGGAAVAVVASIDADCATTEDNTAVSGEVSLSAGANTNICVTVTAEDVSTNKVYTITVYRENANRNIDATLTAFVIDDVNPANGIMPEAVDGVAGACGPNDARTECDDLATDSMPIVDYRVRTVSITATANDSFGAVVDIVSPADKNPSTARHDIDLTAGQVTEIEVMVTAEDTSVAMTFTASVYRKNLNPSDDATLSSLELSGATVMPDFASDTMEYTANAAFSTTQVTVSATTNDDAGGARVAYGSGAGTETDPFMPGTGDDDEMMAGHQVALGAAGSDTEITVQVTAEDGTEDHYTITVTRAEEGTTLLSMYDANDDERIDLSEVNTAIDDYFDGDLTLDEVNDVIDLYFS